jgi:hypothetical protein
LNEVIKYDIPGGYDKMLIPFSKEVDKAIKDYSKLNPKYGTARKAANDYFMNDVVHIRQNVLQSIARSERPESTLAIMNNVSGIRNVEKALNSLPNGKTLTEALKRYKLNTMIRDKILDPSTGLMKVSGLKDFLSRKTKDWPIIQELAGKALPDLQSLEHAGRGLEKGFNNLVNPSKTADTLIALNSILSPSKNIYKGIKNLPKVGGFIDVLKGTSQIIAPRIIAKMVLDPKFANKVYELSRASKRSDWKTFNILLDSIDKEIKEDYGKNQRERQ